MLAFVSGRPSLDLVGTLKWRRDDPEEELVDVSAWRAWVIASGLGVDLVGPVDGQALSRVIDAREALYRAVTAVLDGRAITRADLTRLNSIAAGNGPDMRLNTRGGVQQAGTVDQVLAALVRDALEILGGEDRARLRECVNPRCTRLFIDTSRAGNRRWCGMTECGNAAKVAAFRARRRTSDEHRPRHPGVGGPGRRRAQLEDHRETLRPD